MICYGPVMTEAGAFNGQADATDGRRWLALYVLCVGMLMIILDSTVVNVALPAIQGDLGFAQSDLAWVMNAYLIAFGGLLLLAGRIGDLVGRKDVFMIGLAVFTIASLLCGLAQSQEVLIGARFIQGVGGALTSAVILGMIVTMFPEPREQAKAIGVYSFVASAGASIGLLAGGAITQAISWHWIFFVNLPIGVATAVFALRLVDREPGIGLRRGADVLGASLITGALMLAVYTIVQASDNGFGAARTLILGAISLALLAGFVAREATTRTPLVPLRIFRSRNVSGANVVQILMVAGLFGMFFLGALYLQGVLGYDAVETGLAFLPVSVGIGVLSLGFSARLMARFGERATLLPGLALVATGLLLFSRVPVDASYVVGRAAVDDPARRRRGPLVPGADDARDVGRNPGGLRTRLRRDQHDHAGRRRARTGRARHARKHAQRRPAGERQLNGIRAHGRLPARLRGRRGARARGAGRGGHGAARTGGGCGRRGVRARGRGLSPRRPSAAASRGSAAPGPGSRAGAGRRSRARRPDRP